MPKKYLKEANIPVQELDMRHQIRHRIKTPNRHGVRAVYLRVTVNLIRRNVLNHKVWHQDHQSANPTCHDVLKDLQAILSLQNLG